MVKFAVVGAASLLAFSIAAPVAAQGKPHATVQEGKLEGVSDGEVAKFLGVPFASPPVAENRWKAPLPAEAWKGTRKADALPASCQQNVTPDGFGPWTREYVVTNEVSEDCLYLNVWTPARKAGEALPVMVWIHGGGFIGGSASVPIYDGSVLAEKDMVVIAINYRLGVYGFMAHPDLTAESPSHASGNYGLLDQIAALKWIKANARAFGGDPDRITIAGQSAGAMSVLQMIASPLAKGLFSQAIAQSGAGIAVVPAERDTAEKSGAALMQAAGAGRLSQMRKLTPAQIDKAMAEMPRGGGLGFAPIIDGLVLPDASFVGANTNDTPILAGMTADEMTGLNPAFGKATPESLNATLGQSFGPLAGEISAYYPAKDNAEANAAVSAVTRDKGLGAMALWAKARQAKSNSKIYLYLWTHAEPGPDAERYGAFHSSEIPYIFSTLDAALQRGFTEEDRRLAGAMGDYWANFIKHGDPNGAGLAAWPIYLRSDRQILEIGDETYPHRILPTGLSGLLERHVDNGGTLSLF